MDEGATCGAVLPRHTGYRLCVSELCSLAKIHRDAIIDPTCSLDAKATKKEKTKEKKKQQVKYQITSFGCSNVETKDDADDADDEEEEEEKENKKNVRYKIDLIVTLSTHV